MITADVLSGNWNHIYLDRDRDLELFRKDSDYDSDIPADLDGEESVDFMDGADELGEDTAAWCIASMRMMYKSF